MGAAPIPRYAEINANTADTLPYRDTARSRGSGPTRRCALADYMCAWLSGGVRHACVRESGGAVMALMI